MELMDEVYYSLTGDLEKPLRWVDNVFEEGKPCAQWYQEMLMAYGRLRDRLGIGGEDVDVETVIHAFLMIQETLCKEMYRLGSLESIRTDL